MGCVAGSVFWVSGASHGPHDAMLSESKGTAWQQLEGGAAALQGAGVLVTTLWVLLGAALCQSTERCAGRNGLTDIGMSWRDDVG